MAPAGAGRALLAASALSLALVQGAARAADSTRTVEGRPYSAPTAPDRPTRVLWGDTHLHTRNSLDASVRGTQLGPEEAFRFARGEEVVSTTGVPARLRRPYDFLVVTDHAEYLGLYQALDGGGADVLADAEAKRWYEALRQGRRREIDQESGNDILSGKASIRSARLARTGWERSVAAAEQYNEPGRFTAFIAYEYSSTPDGNNLHRNVIFRDGADKALRVLPFSAFDSLNPEDLWRYMAEYERQFGGQVLAIPHNSNLSGGLMFADRTLGGQPLDRAYAESRARWEPVAEITQTKGDSETTPTLAPDDDFANFERWDRANLGNTRATTAAQLPFNYLRPALTRGLEYAEQLGANPFKYGFVGGTDIHTGLSTADADNFFGLLPAGEPGPKRLASTLADPSVPDPLIMQRAGSGGISAVWAPANTRAAIFDALRRREVYATTGPRIIVRVFAGWHFKVGDESRSDFAAYGYARGVPMGGDLSGARAGQAPTLLVQAAKDADGANLDRVQVVKGWLDVSGAVHERVVDVAWSGTRRAGADGKVPAVGDTVNVAQATYSNHIGAAVLTAAWTDPDFNRAERAYFYVRVIEIPTPRWSTYDARRFGGKVPEEIPRTVTQRAYTSPIWYAPHPDD